MAHERKCIVDLKEYKYCNKCGGYNANETWRFVFCSENCRGIYGVVEKFISGNISALEAQELLKNYDLSEKDHFHPHIKKRFEEIFAVKPEVKEIEIIPEVITKESIEETVEVVSEEKVEEVPVVEKTYNRRKRKTTTEINE